MPISMQVPGHLIYLILRTGTLGSDLLTHQNDISQPVWGKEVRGRSTNQKVVLTSRDKVQMSDGSMCAIIKFQKIPDAALFIVSAQEFFFFTFFLVYYSGSFPRKYSFGRLVSVGFRSGMMCIKGCTHRAMILCDGGHR